MAIGKGSMARAAKTNTKVTAPKAEVAEVKLTEKEAVSKAAETTAKKPAAKTTAKKTTKTAASKTTSVKTTKTVKATSKSVEKQADTKTSVLTPSDQVMEQIVYQKSAQVLDRDAKDNETFGVGDAMPVYFY